MTTEFQFVNTDELMDQKSPNENRYFCEICDRKLNDIHLNDDELERFKTTDGFYHCNICYKFYRNIDALKEHQTNEHFAGKDLKVKVEQKPGKHSLINEIFVHLQIDCLHRLHEFVEEIRHRICSTANRRHFHQTRCPIGILLRNVRSALR